MSLSQESHVGNDARQLAAALHYLQRGLSVFPIRPDGSKAPGIASWKPFQTTAADEEQLRNWFTPGRAGIGIVGGKVSGNLLILDFERVDLFDSWLAIAAPLLEENEVWRDTLPIVETPRPGRHFYLRCVDPVPGNDKLAMGSDGKTTLIETRGEGGYVLAPGSPAACHPTGREYRFIQQGWIDGNTGVRTIGAELLGTLLGIARALDRSPAKTPATEWESSSGVHNGERPGDAFNRRADWRGILEPHGWRIDRVDGGVTYWTRPDKGKGVSATTGFCTNGDGVSRLCVFSSNAHPFQANSKSNPVTYSPFAAFALLEHRGDFTAAARALGGERQRTESTGSKPAPEAPKPGKSDEYRFRFAPITSKELAEGDFRIDWLVSWKLAAMQPGVIAAFAKGMKTSIAIDLVVSLGSGTPFLGKFDVPRRVRVALLSGESGKYAIQETARRICRAKGIELADVDALWGFDLPQLGDVMDLTELAAGLKAARVEVVIIDPLYLCLLSGESIGPDASKNVYAIGPLLLAISRRCLENGVTPILIHHSNRGVEVGKPMELQHISGAGVAEFARQWILLNRDTAYQGDGVHSIWMNIGGSCGQGGLHLLRIEEGTAQEEGGRHWAVEVFGAADAVKEKQEAKKSKSEANKEERLKIDLERCYELVCQLCEPKPHIAVKRQIRAAGNWSDDRADMLIQRLLIDGRIESKAIKPPKRKKGGYRKPTDGYCPKRKKDAETL